ncbi:MAG: hypothetical protein ABL951_14475 [Alphaproteobacteria bacterium]
MWPVSDYALRMNYWFWLLITLTPIIIFSVKPGANMWLRTGRLVLAVGFAYIFINLSLHLKLDREWEAYDSCRSEHGGSYPYEKSLALKLDKICPSAPHTGPMLVTYFVLGWVPAAGYTGFWELIWRLRYHSGVRKTGKAFKGKWLSNVLILFAFTTAYYSSLFFSGLSSWTSANPIGNGLPVHLPLLPRESSSAIPR